MKNTSYFFLLLLVTAFLHACQPDQPATSTVTGSSHGLSLLTNDNPGWRYQNLRIYPVIADAAALTNQGSVQQLHPLSEAISKPGFRITELKPFGRSERLWYHGLTVQNKTRDTIYLMAGDVVTGGNQDRVLAHDDVILPASLKNVDVFCVERGRSHYYDESAPIAEKEVGAFNGYFSVASPSVRRAVQRTNQAEVWAAADQITAANNAGSQTHTYAGLGTENDRKTLRDACIAHFAGQFQDIPNMVGMVVVCGDQVLGADIFGHPDLFKRQYAALLHGYAAEADTNLDSGNSVSALQVFEKVARLAAPKAKDTDVAGKFSRGDSWVHLYSK